MTACRPLVIFHNGIDVSSQCLCLCYEINPAWMHDKRRVFLEQLGKTLVTPYTQRREHLPRTAASAVLVKAIQEAESGPDAPETRAGKKEEIPTPPLKE
ncbi:hypothetical protein LDENG_00085640 [Lucifuga dentata]|nr:hypothetical protein LDENG_00085640 [Lucifuga dentata]